MSDTSEPEVADLSNWRSSPHSRWAFRNVPRLLPVADIAASSQPMPLPEKPFAFERFGLGDGSGGTLGFDDVLKATDTDGLVVLHRGCIVHETYRHGLTPHTPHIIMSASKSIVGLIAGILAGEGTLDIDAPVSAYVPEIAATAYAHATLRHLLDMRAGVVLDERQARAYAIATNWEPLAATETPIGLSDFFRGLDVVPQPHGGPFRYVSANTDLLGWAIERATGQSFASLISERLWQPMGAEDRAFLAVDRDGLPRCTGGICATLRDLARVGQLMLAGGHHDGRQIIPRAWLDDIAEDGDRAAWAQGEFAAGFGGRTMSYRSGWYVVHDQPGMLFAMGIHGQNLFVDRANQIVIAKLSSQHLPIDPRVVGLTHRAVGEMRRCLSEG